SDLSHSPFPDSPAGWRPLQLRSERASATAGPYNLHVRRLTDAADINGAATNPMDPFHYLDNQLFAEDVAVADIAARHGTPCYIYSRAALESRLQAYEDALAGHDHLTCFAVKANSNLAVLDVLARKGAGFDIVSGGELERVIAAGGDPHKVIFSGLGKTEDEIARALSLGIQCFNIESEPELERINAVAARMGTRAPISLRVNPDVDAGT